MNLNGEINPGLETGSFFTRRGKAYITALETKALIDSSDYTKKQKEAASVEVDQILENIVYDSVKLLIENKELNYSESLKWYVLFLSKFGKINRQETYLLFDYKTYQHSRRMIASDRF